MNKNYELPISHIKDLLRNDNDVLVGKEAVEACQIFLQTFKPILNEKIDQVMKKKNHKIIKEYHLENALNNLGYSTDYNFEDKRLTKADMRRLLEHEETDYSISGKAIEFAQIFIEGLIRTIGEKSLIYLEALGRKTLNDDCIKQSLQSMDPNTIIPYKDFLHTIFTTTELEMVCTSLNLPVKSNKSRIIQILTNNSITIAEICNALIDFVDFLEIQQRMIKKNFPIAESYQDIFLWVKTPNLEKSQDLMPESSEPLESSKSIELTESPNSTASLKSQDSLKSPESSISLHLSKSEGILESSSIETEELEIDESPIIESPQIMDNEIEDIATNILEKQKNIEQQEENDTKRITEEILDYNKYFESSSNKLILKEIICDLLPISELKYLNNKLDLNIDISQPKDALADEFLKSGISATYFIRELLVKHLKEFLRILKLKVSGNKKSLLERLLNSVSFADYDLDHDDVIFATKGEGFYLKELKRRKKEKDIEKFFYDKIRNYSGSVKLDLLFIMEELNFKANENELQNKFKEAGREQISFYGPISGLLRDGIVSVDPLSDDKTYFIPEHIFEYVKDGLMSVRKDMKKWEGVVDEIPNSGKFLLNLICSQGEKSNTLEIRDQFSQIYKSSQTWTKARELLKERELIRIEYDEDLETNVIFAPRKICPILSGILLKYKDIILKEQQESQAIQKETEESTITSDLLIQELTKGQQELSLIMCNSVTQIDKELLKSVFTSPPGIVYTLQTFHRYLRNMKKIPIGKDTYLINEDLDPETNQKVIIFNYPKIDEIKTKLEEKLFDLNIVKELESYPKSVLTMIKILSDEGGSCSQKELRKNFLQYYSGSTYYSALVKLEEKFISEGINSLGESLIVLPGIFLSDIEEYYLTHPLELHKKISQSQTVEDYLINNFQARNLHRISSCFEKYNGIDDTEIIKNLLYDEKTPLKALMNEIILKKDLKEFCEENNLPKSYNKEALIDQIIEKNLLQINSDIIIDGKLTIDNVSVDSNSKNKEEICTDKTQEESLENIKDEEMQSQWERFIDSTIIFEAILSSPTHSKKDLRKFTKENNLRSSGTKLELVEEIFITSELEYNTLFDQFIGNEELKYIHTELGIDGFTLEDLKNLFNKGIPGLPEKNKVYSLDELVEILPKNELQQICEALEIKKSGNKADISKRIEKMEEKPTEEKIKMILSIAPEWVDSLNNKYYRRMSIKTAKNKILKLVGETVIQKQKKESEASGRVGKQSGLGKQSGIGKQNKLNKNSELDNKPQQKPKSKKKEKLPKLTKDIMGLKTLISQSLDQEIIQEGLYIFENKTSIEQLNESEIMSLLLEIGGIYIRKLIKSSKLPIDISKKPSEMISALLKYFGINTSQNNISISKKVAKLRLEHTPALAGGLSSFARGVIKRGVNDSFQSNKAKENFLQYLSEKEQEDPSVRGVIFEASLYQTLLSLIHTKMIPHRNAKLKDYDYPDVEGILRVKPYANFEKYTDKDEEADGLLHIKLNEAGKNNSYYFIYDCKSTKDKYMPTDHFEIYTKYIRLETNRISALGTGKSIDGIILFSSDFGYNLSTLEKKMNRDPLLREKTLILFPASVLRKIWAHHRDSNGIVDYFPWAQLIDPRKKVIEITEKDVDKYLNEAEIRRDRSF